MSTSTGEHYEFNVKMTCGGCSNAVKRALSKVDGITYDVDLEKQTVTVVVKEDPDHGVSYDDVLEKIKKTGKEVLSGKVVSVKEYVY